MTGFRPVFALLLATALCGCASTPQTSPGDLVQQASSMLQRGNELHFDDYAAPAMREARGKLDAAQKALTDPKTQQQAADFAQEAEVCVQLASAQADAARARANTMALRRQLEQVEQLAHPDATQGDAR